MRDLAAVLIYLDRKHLRRAARLGDRDREQSDRAAAGDRHRLRRDVARQRGVHRIAQRVEDRRVFLRDFGVELPDVGFRDTNEFGEGAVGVYADDLHVLADVRLACSALQTLAAGDMHLGGYEITFFNAGDFVPDCRHVPAELMSWNEGRMDPVLRPGVPVVNVQVGAANARDLYFDENIGGADLRDLDFAHLGSGFRLRLHDRQHGIGHV